MAKDAIRRTKLQRQDIEFIVQSVAPESAHREQLKEMVDNDHAFRKTLLSDQKLFKRITGKNPAILGISPALFFEVLLRHAASEMKEAGHTVERTVSQRIPVFDIDETLDLIRDEDVFYYLVNLMASFVRSEKGTASDTDINRLINLAERSKGNYRFLTYQRIADTCLFILGVYPEYVMYDYIYLFFDKPLPLSADPGRSMGEYEAIGRQFYALASEQQSARSLGLEGTLKLLSENFYLAKKPLNIVSENYLAIATKNPKPFSV